MWSRWAPTTIHSSASAFAADDTADVLGVEDSAFEFGLDGHLAKLDELAALVREAPEVLGVVPFGGVEKHLAGLGGDHDDGLVATAALRKPSRRLMRSSLAKEVLMTMHASALRSNAALSLPSKLALSLQPPRSTGCCPRRPWVRIGT